MIRRGLGGVAIALILVAGLGAAHGQEPAPSEVEQPAKSLDDFDPFPAAPDPGKASPETSAAYQEALQAYFAYRKAGYEHRLRVFEWQSLSTIIIFFVVLLLVLCGIGFAAIQFRAGLQRSRRGGASARRGDRAQRFPERDQGALAGPGRDHPHHLAGLLLSLPGARLPDQECLLTAQLRRGSLDLRLQ